MMHPDFFQYVSFRLGRSLFGISIPDIREIVALNRFTRVHRAPEAILGLMNLRGQILTILNTRAVMGLNPNRRFPGSHVIVFKNRPVGFAVDRIGDVTGVEKTRINSVPGNIHPGTADCLDHVIDLPGEVWMIVNADKMTACIRSDPGTAAEVG